MRYVIIGILIVCLVAEMFYPGDSFRQIIRSMFAPFIAISSFGEVVLKNMSDFIDTLYNNSFLQKVARFFSDTRALTSRFFPNLW